MPFRRKRLTLGFHLIVQPGDRFHEYMGSATATMSSMTTGDVAKLPTVPVWERDDVGARELNAPVAQVLTQLARCLSDRGFSFAVTWSPLMEVST